ncbi:hypothetical protein JYT72_03195, partial [Crocinitomix catalasitica]|nr:hypothetical protein [Crocinitomix catalasitica]
TDGLDSKDEIIHMWWTPKVSGIRLSRDEVVKFLATSWNTAPLWVSANLDRKILILNFCQRFRKHKVILESNQGNELAPFRISKDHQVEFDQSYERKSAIRSAFFSRNVTDQLREIIGESITKDEYFDFLKDHFESYRFYPPLYNHAKIGEKGYSALVIEKDFKKNKYKVFRNPDSSNTIIKRKLLEKCGNEYLINELSENLDGIRITEN